MSSIPPAIASPTKCPLKSHKLPLGLLAGLAIALTLTNPGQPAYVDYAAERLPEELQESCALLGEDITIGSLLNLPMQGFCRSAIYGVDLLARGAAKQVIGVATERQNFALFSLYTTKVPGRTFKTIGVGGLFFTIYGR